MPLSKSEATAALHDIAKTETRSSTAYGYEIAAPFLILWGVLWIVGFGGTDLLDARYANELWAAVNIFGILASLYIGLRRKRGAGGSIMALRWGGTILALAAFVLAP